MAAAATGAARDGAARESADADGERAKAAARHIRRSLVIPVLDRVGDRWILLLLAALADAPRRYDDLARRIGMARSTLAQRLAQLVADGLVERRLYRSNPPRHDYALTEQGRSLLPMLHAIRNWDRSWAPAESFEAWPMEDVAEHRIVCAACRQPIHARDVSYAETPAPGPTAARGARRALASSSGEITSLAEGVRSQRRARRSRDGAARPLLLTSAADVLGNRSLALVVSAGFFGLRRFSDMEKALDLAPNVLSRRLDDLVAAGVLARHVYRERPRRWQYILTEKGLDLYPVIVAQIAWGERWLAGPAGPPLTLTHKSCGRPLRPLLEAV